MVANGNTTGIPEGCLWLSFYPFFCYCNGVRFLKKHYGYLEQVTTGMTRKKRSLPVPKICPVVNPHSYGTKTPFSVGKSTVNGPWLQQQTVELPDGNIIFVYQRVRETSGMSMSKGWFLDELKVVLCSGVKKGSCVGIFKLEASGLKLYDLAIAF